MLMKWLFPGTSIVLQGELAVTAQAAGEIARLGAGEIVGLPHRPSVRDCPSDGIRCAGCLRAVIGKDELDVGILDNVSMAGERLDHMLKMLIADRQSREITLPSGPSSRT
jgi:hypothetical protein